MQSTTMNQYNEELINNEIQGSILIIDDDMEIQRLIKKVFSIYQQVEIFTSNNGLDAIKRLVQKSMQPDLILLDIQMPELNGHKFMEIIKQQKHLREIPVIYLTGSHDEVNKKSAYQNGAIDFITKPFEIYELHAKVSTHIMLKHTKENLQVLVNQKTREIEEMTHAMVSALENVNYYNDSDTGNHILRVSQYSSLLAVKYGCDDEYVNKIKLYSSLHDIGKVGIPDDILNKTGRYDKDEYEKMKEHTIIGGRMLESAHLDPMAGNIALYHHEKWNGSGYGQGLVGEDIPLEARIVALADVFDALSSKRVYKQEYSEEKVNSLIVNSSGKHFEPKLVDIYFENKEEFLLIKKKHFQKREK